LGLWVALWDLKHSEAFRERLIGNMTVYRDLRGQERIAMGFGIGIVIGDMVISRSINE
jgi:hypothetical protein